jgi:hypothetical protein
LEEGLKKTLSTISGVPEKKILRAIIWGALRDALSIENIDILLYFDQMWIFLQSLLFLSSKHTA